ncbi:hypothetical protein [Bradyrhizobium betae]|uniref:Uncharacterized protein n=1 Tax=Bradyrhizobium betae TaxID=244734 RepID=A0A5P6P0F3_9BRAD|nr:hypothetical protein [Bradyrhizobium betae]MCS3728234.1 hypothetical protein [Bradyrhizobium betae]QFI71780.1 hypothetical protein F8237_04975 [Bradyrhizobium betae]
MIALMITCAGLPSMFAVACATLLALKDRKQWVWFAGLAILAGFAGLTVLNMLELWRYSVHS